MVWERSCSHYRNWSHSGEAEDFALESKKRCGKAKLTLARALVRAHVCNLPFHMKGERLERYSCRGLCCSLATQCSHRLAMKAPRGHVSCGLSKPRYISIRQPMLEPSMAALHVSMYKVEIMEASSKNRERGGARRRICNKYRLYLESIPRL